MGGDERPFPPFWVVFFSMRNVKFENKMTTNASDMKKLLLSVAVLAMVCGTADAQSFLEKMKEKAKNAVEQNIGNKVEKGVNDVLDGKIGKKDKKGKETADQAGSDADVKPGNDVKPGSDADVKPGSDRASAWTCEECGKTGNTGKFCDDCGAKKPGGEADAPKPAPKKQTSSNYAKSDFVPGDEIFFEDTFENEQLGEFPSHWDLLDGYAEVAEVDGRKVIAFTDAGQGVLLPLMKEKLSFLPDVFTVEYDLYLSPVSDGAWDSAIVLDLQFGNANTDYDVADGEVGHVWFNYREDGSSSIGWSMQKPSGDAISGSKDLGLSEAFSDYNGKDNPLKAGEWNHFAYSFNKRAFKGYINGMRIINIPVAKAPAYLRFRSSNPYRYSGISNFRLAKGAVPLYDRLASEGKIITYAITFEVGKADLKPESMVEINRIAKLMQENPGLEFEVQGHCDATGSDKVNDPLSQKRAEAIVAALVEQGIAQARLSAVGKGSHVPIASNSTDEGRAKNRRVEFVKK